MGRRPLPTHLQLNWHAIHVLLGELFLAFSIHIVWPRLNQECNKEYPAISSTTPFHDGKTTPKGHPDTFHTFGLKPNEH